MGKDDSFYRDLFTGLLLVVGFCSAIGVVGLLAVGMPLPMGGVFFLGAAVGLPWGIFLVRRSARTARVLAGSCVASLLFSPVWFVVGVAVFLAPPFVWGMWGVLTGADVVQSVTSPDGKFEAYVRDEPSTDGPNQSCYVQRDDVVHFAYIAKLAEDVDRIQEILWSPHGDIAVFRTRDYLIAARVPGYQTVKLPLAGEWRRSKPSKRSTFSSGGPRQEVAAIEFPDPGVFRYRLDGSEEFKSVEMDAL